MFTVLTGVGYTGRRVLERLPTDAVAGLSRSVLDTDRRYEILDLDVPSPLPVELHPPYAVIYTVPPKGSPPDARLRHFLDLLEPAPARFVYISTTGVYGDCDGRRVAETDHVQPASERSMLRVAAERLISAWADQRDCAVIVLRTPGIYGPGRLGIERIRAGKPVLAEDSANPGNRIHVDDLADCCVAALAPGVPAGIYNVGDGDHRSASWFTIEAARQAGLPRPPEIGREAAAKEFSAMRLSFLSESRRIDTSKMRRVLGVTPCYANPEDGIRASLEAEEAEEADGD
ncbi:MAG: NAD-dependent epimerase/dehydratase family protein [Gammaproteobacteria bacterium]|nr:NAD-dependent epimerase/dehydratase family protein [Gammaproteobacteria bacterium]